MLLIVEGVDGRRTPLVSMPDFTFWTLAYPDDVKDAVRERNGLRLLMPTPDERATFGKLQLA